MALAAGVAGLAGEVAQANVVPAHAGGFGFHKDGVFVRGPRGGLVGMLWLCLVLVGWGEDGRGEGWWKGRGGEVGALGSHGMGVSVGAVGVGRVVRPGGEATLVVMVMVVVVRVGIVWPHGRGDGGGHVGGGGSGGPEVVWSRSGGLPLCDALWHNRLKNVTKGDELGAWWLVVCCAKKVRPGKKTKTTVRSLSVFRY